MPLLPPKGKDVTSTFLPDVLERQEGVQTYLRDVGSVNLLTRGEERALGLRIETLNHLTEYEVSLGRQRDSSTWRIALQLLTNICHAGPIVDALNTYTEGSNGRRPLGSMLSNPSLREVLDGVTKPEVCGYLAQTLHLELSKTGESIRSLSLDSRLLPPAILKIVGPHSTLQDVGKRLDERTFIQELVQSEQSLHDYFVHLKDVGKRAHSHLVEANLRLVISVARRYTNRGMSFSDLVQEGNIGLIRAARKYSFRRGLKFSTYAVWWIRQGIMRAIADQSRTIRIPVHMTETVNSIFGATDRLTSKLQRDPTTIEIASELNMSPERVESLRGVSQLPLSLDQSYKTDFDTPLGDIVEDTRTSTPEEDITSTLLKERLSGILGSLPERDAGILTLRFGLVDRQPHTLEQIGHRYSITRERVRQIEAKAIRKLRGSPAARALHGEL